MSRAYFFSHILIVSVAILIARLPIAFAQTQNMTNTTSTNVSDLDKKSKNEKLSVDWKSEISGLSNSNENSQSKFVDFRVELKTDYKIADHFNLLFIPVFKFQSGSSQTLSPSDSTGNKLLFKEASLNLQPIEMFVLSAGALNQNFEHNSLLIGDNTFPGLRGQIFAGNNHHFSLILESAVPTSNTLSTNTNEKESTPTFNTALLQSKLDWKNTQELRMNMGIYQFNNLPSSVAGQSYLYGNSVQKTSDLDGQFLYQYQGVEASLASKTTFKPISLIGKAYFVQNNKAPAGLNQAYSGYGGIEFLLSKERTIGFGLLGFRAEPDSTVAYFSSNRYFNTNRVGYGVESYFTSKKDNYRVGVKYSEAEVIYLSPVQSREKSILLKLETFYADI